LAKESEQHEEGESLILDALDGVSGVEEGEADEKCLVTSESMIHSGI